jgi:hypothetical protein
MSLRKASQYWKHTFDKPIRPSHCQDYIKKTSRKHGPLGILSVDEEVVVVEWVFGMQECSLSISLH